MRILTFLMVFVFSFASIHTVNGVYPSALHAEEFDDLGLDDLDDLNLDDLDEDLGDFEDDFEDPLQEEEEEKEEKEEEPVFTDDSFEDSFDDSEGFAPEEETPVDQFNDFSDTDNSFTDDSFSDSEFSESSEKMAALYLFTDSYTREKTSEAVREIATAIIENPRISYIDTETNLFGNFSGIRSDMDRAQRLFESGKRKYNELFIEEAIKNLEHSLSIIEKHIAVLTDFELLSNVLLYLATSHRMFGENQKAESFMKRYIFINPDKTLDQNVFSPDITDFFRDIKENYSAYSDEGAVAFDTDPPGALVFVDGKVRGTTPLTVSGIKSGKHYYRLHKLGYENSGNTVDVHNRETARIRNNLRSIREASYILDSETELLKEFGNFFMLRNSLEIAEKMNVDKLLLCRLDTSDGEAVIDLITVRTTERDFKKANFRAAFSSYTGSFGSGNNLKADVQSYFNDTFGYEKVSSLATQSLDSELGLDEKTEYHEKEDEKSKDSVLKKWWFWTIIGGAVAAGAGVGTYFLLRPDGSSGATLEVDFNK